jgi:hypothetical protein
MSWIDEIKLAKWLNNGTAMAQTFGVNLIGKAVQAVDNPTYLTTLPDGSQAAGRTEITFLDPNQPLTWTVANAPAVAAERWITNYGIYTTSNAYGRFCRRGFIINAVRWRSQGITPAQNILLKLYVNSSAAGASWQTTIFAAGGPNLEVVIAPPSPLVVSSGSVIGISLTQAGAGVSANMNAIISVT